MPFWGSQTLRARIPARLLLPVREAPTFLPIGRRHGFSQPCPPMSWAGRMMTGQDARRPLVMGASWGGEGNLAMLRCPACGHDLAADASACSACGRPLNGAAMPEAEAHARRPALPGAPPCGKLSPELMEWARQQFSEEEFVAGLREIRETGGLELQDFIRELEQEAAPRD